MKEDRMTRLIIALFAAPLLFGGCINTPTNNNTGTGSGTVFLWISSDKDTYISCGRTGTCEEGELNFGKNGSLVVADWELAHKRSYVHFVIPTLPENTEILEAYVELFHGGKNEDGKRDDILIPAANGNAAWSPHTLTWNNAAEKGTTPAANFNIKLESQAWSGSENIAGIAKQIFAKPSEYYGFIFWWSMNMNGGLGIEKGFYSNNDISRKQNELGKAPRLLVKIKLPTGKTTNDIVLPFFAPDNDLDALPRPTTMLLFRQADDWPTDWDVAHK
jgi:hypothetical protein